MATDGTIRTVLRRFTPEPMRAVYRRSKLLSRSLIRSLFGIKTCYVRDVVVRIHITSELEHYRADSYATKEPETLDWLEQHLTGKDVFMDVGANIGLYSIYAARLQPACTIYAFEPEAQNFSRLCGNIVLNEASNVLPCNFPLADQEQFGLLYVGSLEPGSALHSFGGPSSFRTSSDEGSLRQGAVSMTLDALVEKYGLPQPTLLKIDVDGLEGKILAGAQTVLKSGKLRTVLLELNYDDASAPGRTEQAFAGFGYTLRWSGAPMWERNGIKSQNLIFERA